MVTYPSSNLWNRAVKREGLCLAHEVSTVTHFCGRTQFSGLAESDSIIAGYCVFYSRRGDGEELAGAVACCRRLVADLSTRSLAFDPRLVYVGFAIHKKLWDRFFYVFPYQYSLLPSVLHTHLSITDIMY